MSLEQLNLYSQNDGVLVEKKENLTHLGQNISKLQKTKKSLEKNLDCMAVQVTETNKQLVNLKIEGGKLKKKLEKSEHKRNSLTVVLQKMNEDLKQKDELLKKQTSYINKLESQLIKGTLSLELMENVKKLEEKNSSLERELKELQALNQALKTKNGLQEERLDLLNSCLQINLNEFFQETSIKLSPDELLRFSAAKSQASELEGLRNELSSLRITNSNHLLEISSYQETLQKSFLECKMLKNALEELKRTRNVDENREKTVKTGYESEITELKEQIVAFSGKYNRIFEEKLALEEENRRASESLREYQELVGVCEEVFSGDFESVLRESLGVISEKKAMKQKIRDIVKDCTQKLMGQQEF